MALSNDFPSSYDLSLTEVPSGVRALFVHDHPPTKNTLRVTLTVLQKFYLNWNLQNPSEMIAYLIVTYVASASSSASNITNSQVPSKCFHTSAMDSTEGDHITLHISTETLFAQRKRQYTVHIHCRDQSLRRGYDHYILKDRSVRRFSPNFGIKVDEAIANFCGTIADV